eukprot:503413_1
MITQNQTFLFSMMLSPENKKKEEPLNKCGFYQLYNDIQFPFNKLFIDIRNNDKYRSKHIVNAINVSVNCTSDSLSNQYKILKKNLHRILKQQTYVLSQIWFYNDEPKTINETVCKEICQIIKSILLSQPDLSINILNCTYQTFENKFPFLCNDNTIIKANNNLNMKQQTETDHLLKQYLGIMLNINEDNIILYPSNIIDDKLYLGNAQHALNKKILTDLNITHIINCTQDIGCLFNIDIDQKNNNNTDEKTQSLNIKYFQIPVADTQTQQIVEYFIKVIDFIIDAFSTNNDKNRILCHCQAGISRSSTIVIAYLMYSNQISMVNALQYVKSKRNIICPNTGFSKQLLIFDQYLKHLKYDKTQINEVTFEEFMDKNGKDTTGFNLMYYELMDYIDQYFRKQIGLNIIIGFVNKYYLIIQSDHHQFWGKIINHLFINQRLQKNIHTFIDLILILFEKQLISNDNTIFSGYLAQHFNDMMLTDDIYCKHLATLFAKLLDKGYFKQSLVYIFCNLCSFEVNQYDDIEIEEMKTRLGLFVSLVVNILNSLKRDDMVKKNRISKYVTFNCNKSVMDL